MSKPRKDELTAKKERLAKLFAEQDRLDKLMQTEFLGFSGRPSNPREKELFTIKSDREKAYERLEVVLNKIAAAKRGDEGSAVLNLNDLETRKKELFAIINALPDIGFTHEEWKNLDDSMRKKRVGRPAVSLEQNIIRTRAEVESLMQEITTIQGHSDLDDVYALAQDVEFIEKKTGRVPFDSLGSQDYSLRQLREKIEYITSGRAQADIDKKMETAKYSSNGKRLGRSFESLDDRLLSLQKEERKLVKMISRMESELNPEDMIKRRIKLLTDRRNEVRRLIRLDMDVAANIASTGADQALIESNQASIANNRAMLEDILKQIQAAESELFSLNPEQRRPSAAYTKPDLELLLPARTSATKYVPRAQAAEVISQQSSDAIAAQATEEAMQARKSMQDRGQVAAEAVRQDVEVSRETAAASAKETRGVVNRLMGHRA